MKKSILLAFTIMLGLFSFAQTVSHPTCNGSRYWNEDYVPAVNAGITYGQNVSQNGQTTTLKMDIYQPTGDMAAKRPLAIFAFGGSFIGGSRTSSDMIAFCEKFSKLGFVTATIDYRVGVNILSADSFELARAVMRATHDMRAAIRFFMKDAYTTNTYRIDTNYIFIGGTSAGAVTALHAAYLTKDSETPQYIMDIMTPWGGMPGTSGNPGYTMPVKGVLNLAGCLSQNSFIADGGPDLCSMHGTADDVVPYGHTLLYFSGIVPIKVVDGSGSIHPFAQTVGMNTRLYTWVGGGHVPYTSSALYMDTTLNYLRDFLFEEMCGTATGLPEGLKASDFSVYPNPTLDNLTIRNDYAKAEAFLMDITGKNIASYTLPVGETTISVGHLPRGLYIVNIQSEGKQYSQKVEVR